MSPNFRFVAPGEIRVRKPSGPPLPGQPSWNAQQGSMMPASRYSRPEPRIPFPLPARAWPAGKIESPPLWCSVDLRDGNQALPTPMDIKRKSEMFELLVRMGFKQIEVGYPAASETEFSFVQHLIKRDLIPDDVTIVVFTPARPELIDRTLDSIQGVDQAVVHLCLATACLWREVVFGMSAAELSDFTICAAQHVVKLADAMTGSSLRFEYSPETFNLTEPEFALSVSNEVMSVFGACAERPVILNLPSTIETDSPNVYADQIEWMHRNLGNRNSIILSVHPHNDRGTAVASAELALMAGADRVEGTLFGNGERTGNVCLATLALNMFSSGIDPQLDFTDVDGIRRTVEFCNQMPVHARHPYVGDLVYTAFSGTHQDAIAKGMAALDAQAQSAGRPVGDLRWEVPYLPIDPHDVGRSYESVVRLNSQSGKGGVAHILNRQYGVDLPRGLRIDFARVVQKVAEESGTELNSCQLWDLFKAEYLAPRGCPLIKQFRNDAEHGQVHVEAVLADPDGGESALSGSGTSVGAATVAGFSKRGDPIRLRSLISHPIGRGAEAQCASYAEVSLQEVTAWGAGLDESPARAALCAVVAAVSHALSHAG
jgi:2-isopropylmalate synthase